MGSSQSNSRRSSITQAPPLPPRPLPATTAEPRVHKGLFNDASSHNCFLNVVVQSLWHLGAFRSRFPSLSSEPGHLQLHRDAKSSKPSQPLACVLCALTAIFVGFEYSEQSILPPTELRMALAENDDLGRFNLGQMADAEEALEAILLYLHAETIHPRDASTACAPPTECISHQVFGGSFMDVRVCSTCHSVSEPQPLNTFLYRITACELLNSLATATAEMTDYGLQPIPFEKRLRALYQSPATACPQREQTNCTGFAATERWILSSPIVFSLMFIWQRDVSRQDIDRVWHSLPERLCYDDFLANPDKGGEAVNRNKQRTYAVLRGAICYYGLHYVSFFFAASLNTFLLFDDKRVVKVGTWQQVLNRVSAGKLRPITVFYERRDSPESVPMTPRTLVKHVIEVHADDDVFHGLEVLPYATPRHLASATARR